jgi:hypothetical protein
MKELSEVVPAKAALKYIGEEHRQNHKREARRIGVRRMKKRNK